MKKEDIYVVIDSEKNDTGFKDKFHTSACKTSAT